MVVSIHDGMMSILKAVLLCETIIYVSTLRPEQTQQLSSHAGRKKSENCFGGVTNKNVSVFLQPACLPLAKPCPLG